MHYNVVLDENGYKMEASQTFIHEACFQFICLITSVSQFPAIYYSHICAARGVILEAKPVSAQSDGKKEIQARILQGKTEREAIDDYRRKQASRIPEAQVVYMDSVQGKLGENMWYA
jgi:eukaryotic translation initiation factor 2C